MDIITEVMVVLPDLRDLCSSWSNMSRPSIPVVNSPSNVQASPLTTACSALGTIRSERYLSYPERCSSLRSAGAESLATAISGLSVIAEHSTEASNSGKDIPHPLRNVNEYGLSDQVHSRTQSCSMTSLNPLKTAMSPS